MRSPLALLMLLLVAGCGHQAAAPPPPACATESECVSAINALKLSLAGCSSQSKCPSQEEIAALEARREWLRAAEAQQRSDRREAEDAKRSAFAVEVARRLGKACPDLSGPGCESAIAAGESMLLSDPRCKGEHRTDCRHIDAGVREAKERQEKARKSANEATWQAESKRVAAENAARFAEAGASGSRKP